jgi:hypothetical protein
LRPAAGDFYFYQSADDRAVFRGKRREPLSVDPAAGIENRPTRIQE